MKTANIVLKLRPTLTIAMTGVTPAEAQFLVAEHQKHAKGQPVEVDFKSEGEIERSDEAEFTRLMGKYNNKRLAEMYPPTSFRFPDSYETALAVGLRFKMPVSTFQGEETKPARPTGDE